MYRYIYTYLNTYIYIYIYLYEYICIYNICIYIILKDCKCQNCTCCTPCVTKPRVIWCIIQMQCKIFIAHWIAIAFLHTGSDFIWFLKVGNYNNKHSYVAHPSMIRFFQLLFWGSRAPQTMEDFKEISIVGRKCLYVSGKVHGRKTFI